MRSLGLIGKGVNMKGFYKVPFRAVYCDSIRSWLASCVEIFIVYKLRPPVNNLFSDGDVVE